MNNFFKRDAEPVLALMCISVFLFFFYLGRNGLWNSDEARYSEGGREMAVSGDFLIPRVDTVPRINKPPLVYWLGAVAYKTFGMNEFAARFFSAMAGLFGVLLAYYFAKEFWGRRASFLAGVILATSGEYFVLARVITTDMELSILITTSIFFWLRGYLNKGKINYILFWIFVALGMLQKGLMAIVIPSITILPFLFFKGELKRIKETLNIIGILLFLVIALPWYILAEIKYPGYLNYFFLGQNIEAFYNGEIHHGHPFYHTFGFLALGMLPWSVFIPYMIYRLVKVGFGNLIKDTGLFFFACWGIISFLFYTVAISKLMTYILPVYPPFAIMLGWLAEKVITEGKKSKAFIISCASFSVILLAAILYVFIAPDVKNQLSEHLSIAQLVCVAGGLCILGIFAFIFAVKERFSLVFGVLASVAFAVIAALPIFSRSYEEESSSKAVIMKVKPLIRDDTRVVCIQNLEIRVPFYLDRKAKTYVFVEDIEKDTRVFYRIGIAESIKGMEEETKKLLLNPEQFNKALQTEDVVGFAQPEEYEKLSLDFKRQVKTICKNKVLVAFTNR